MSEFATKASLASLPPELIGFIIPHTINLDLPLEACIDSSILADLRALSQTCRRLREVTLPLVWARVELKTVKQLGELHALLQAVPSIAPLVRSFRFLWNMDGDCSSWHLRPYPEKAGTALDLAFRDRRRLWDSIMKEGGAEYEMEGVFWEGFWCTPPGEAPEWKAVKEQGVAAYDWQAGARGRGPDGDGEDRLNKNAAQFTQCITEVVGMLSSLETFGWETIVTPMPRGVFDALARIAKPLNDLRLVFSTYRGNFTDLPLWELSGRLKALSLRYEESQPESTYPYESPGADLDGDPGRTLADIEAHFQSPLDYETLYGDDEEARDAAHVAIGCRTVIAALRGGQLRRHQFHSEAAYGPQYLYRVRALLPYWLQIEDWGASQGPWPNAAKQLRPFLAHSWRHRDWLGTCSSSVSHANRRLTASNFQLMHVHFADPRAGASLWSAVKCYLPWLAEDTVLAQPVVDAWHVIVDRGEADKVKCCCERCGGPDW